MTQREILQPYIDATGKAMREVEGDYYQDNILYCGKCNTPKQITVTIADVETTVPCLCDCGVVQRDKEIAEFNERKRQAEIRALRISGIHDKSIRGMTFDADDGSNPDATNKAKRYVAKWDKMRHDNIGLLLWGNTGNGKTFTAACIANALIDRNVPVLMTSFPQILSGLTGLFGDDRVAYVRSLINFPLLIIDDLGAERDSEFSREQIYAVIDARYKQRLPLIITTNLTLDELKKPKDIECRRIYDRILEMCVPIYFSGDSRRKVTAAEKMKLAKAMFE